MLIKIDINNVEVIFDHNGNVYFKLDQDKQMKLYDLSITNDNKISLYELVSYDLIKATDINKGELKLINKELSLKGKILKEKEKEKDPMNENFDSDDDEEETKYNQYYYENNSYFEDYVDNNENIDTKVSFLNERKSTYDIKIYDGDAMESSTPLYDTLLYENNIADEYPFYKVSFINIEPIYRLKIYKSGEITFRPIGSKQYNYKLRIVNENLVLGS
jgi:hypothetical protein